MQIAIALIVVAAVVAIVWWRLQNRSQAVPVESALEDDLSGVKPPTTLEFDGSTAIATFDLRVPDDGPDEALRDLLLKQGHEAILGKGVDVERLSIRAWRKGHVVEVAHTKVAVAQPSDHDPSMPEAADFDPLGDLHNKDFGSGVSPQRTTGELSSLAEELSLTDDVKGMLRAKGVDVSSMSMTQMTVALLESTGYSVSPGSMPGTYDARNAAGHTFLTVVDHEKGDYPELAEEAVDSFVIRFMSSGADRGLLFTEKYCPYAVYDKEKREPRIRFITRERLQAFVDSVAMR